MAHLATWPLACGAQPPLQLCMISWQFKVFKDILPAIFRLALVVTTDRADSALDVCARRVETGFAPQWLIPCDTLK
eukprot:8875571-Karenia_brevis.AAC.1